MTVLQNLADLQVTAIDPIAGPIRAGELVTVAWTVTNLGTGQTNALSWRDRIYLWRDDLLGNGDDVQLASVTRTNPLGGRRHLHRHGNRADTCQFFWGMLLDRVDGRR